MSDVSYFSNNRKHPDGNKRNDYGCHKNTERFKGGIVDVRPCVHDDSVNLVGKIVASEGDIIRKFPDIFRVEELCKYYKDNKVY